MLRGALRGICPAEALGIPRMQNRPVVGPVRAGESDNFCRARPAKRPQSAFTDTIPPERPWKTRRGQQRPSCGSQAPQRPLFSQTGTEISTQGPLARPGRTKTARDGTGRPEPSGRNQAAGTKRPEPSGRNQAAGTKRPEPGGRNRHQNHAKKGQKPRRRRRETITPATTGS